MKTTVRGLVLAPLPAEATDLMRRYCAGVRFAYKRLAQGMRTLVVEKAVGATYALNSRYAKDAVHEAAGLITAQQKLVKLRCLEWGRKLAAAERKLSRARSPLKQAGLRAKVDKRSRRLAFWERHRQAGAHPSIVFGGRRAFHDRCAGTISRETWQDRRNNRLVSRGDKTKGGNLNLRLVSGGPGGAVLHIAIPGEGRFAQRVAVPVYLPQKRSRRTGRINGRDWRQLVLNYLSAGRAYQVELVRRDGQVYCHITLEEPVPEGLPTTQYLGVDTNPTGLGVALVGPDGNFRRSWWLGDGELTYARQGRRANRVGELAARLVTLAGEQGAALVIEDLQFADDREVNAKFHRMAHQFVYAGLLAAIVRGAARAGVPVVKVHPAWTSAIGALKYAHQYRLRIHAAAALVIARRGMGLDESVPRPLRQLVRGVEFQSEWKAWAAVKRAAVAKLKARGVKSLVSWPQHRNDVLGLAREGA